MSKLWLPPRRGLNRRGFLKNAGLAMAAASAGYTLHPRSVGTARAADDSVVRVLGVSNGPPKTWDEFTAKTGLTVEWTPIGDDVGIFLHEMMANDAGERYDLVKFRADDENCRARIPLLDDALMDELDRPHVQTAGRVRCDEQLERPRQLARKDHLLLVAAGE